MRRIFLLPLLFLFLGCGSQNPITPTFEAAPVIFVEEATLEPPKESTPTYSEMVLRNGRATLSINFEAPASEKGYFDLDTGSADLDGRDIAFDYSIGSGIFVSLRSIFPASFYSYGGEEPSFSQCNSLRKDFITASHPEVYEGNNFCVLTNEGRLASLRITENELIKGVAHLSLDFIVWEPIVEILATRIPKPVGCLKPPDDYTRIEVNGQILNQRTLSMLHHTAELYTGPIDVANLAITQGSYTDAIGLSFGTHASGGAVDISVVARERFEILWDELPPLLQALRTAGFAAWLRETGELSPTSAVHIHAIAIGDAEASEDAEAQLTGEYGYFRGYNGLPPDFGGPALDKYGEPILCNWMRELGYADLRN